MSGWRIVPARLPGDSDADYVARINVAPEPDWEALAGIVLNDDVYDQYATGGEIRRLAAAMRATFWSKP